MRPRLRDSGRSTTDREIRAAERQMKVRFPETYRVFLASSNGGVPEPNVCRPDGSGFVIDLFFEIDARKKFRDLVGVFKHSMDRLPGGVVPIALDAFGNQICLSTTGENTGKIYFWDHEMPVDGYDEEDPMMLYPELFSEEEHKEASSSSSRPVRWAGYPPLALIAASFDEFLDGFVDEG